MKQILFFQFNLFFSFTNSITDIEKKAVIIVPVADASIISLEKINSDKSTHDIYNQMPFSPHQSDHSCYRAHQFIFNEVVSIIQEKDDEVQVEPENIYYVNESGKEKNYYWLLKKNIKKLNRIYPRKIDLTIIPEPFSKPIYNKNILTLKLPWENFLVGTRFVRSTSLDDEMYYGIWMINRNSRRVLRYVPKELAIISYPEDQKDAIKEFVEIIKSWINYQSGVIPYLWGGKSFIKKFPENYFYQINDVEAGKKISYWTRPEITDIPYTGFDCSGLIFRAAQIFGLPYFFANTATLSKKMKPLKKDEEIEEGDLIWYQGHVLIVSDIKNNKLIEAAGYQSGFGKLHEIELERVFENINTYQDISDAYFKKSGLKRIDINKNVIRQIPKFLILKMTSIF